MPHNFLMFLILQDLPAYTFYFYNLAFFWEVERLFYEIKNYQIFDKILPKNIFKIIIFVVVGISCMCMCTLVKKKHA